VVASIRFEAGEFPSAAPVLSETDGHLIIIRGFTPAGDVIVNDPASREHGHGVVYKADELAKAWFGHGGLGYVIAGPAHAGGAPVVQPPATQRVVDMLLLGRVGAARSEVSRGVIVVGDYAYVSGEPGLQTVRIGEGGKLTLSDEWRESSLKVNGAAVKGKTLYVANWSPGAGLAVFDLTGPAHPRHVRSLETKAHAWSCDVHDELLYVSVDDGMTTGVATYDVSDDPHSPRPLHWLDVGDRLVGNVARHGRFMYFTHKQWLYVYDAADPAQPRRLREIRFNGLAGKTLVRGRHLYVLTRAVEPGQEGGVHVLALGDDPGSPKPVARWVQEEPRDMHFAGADGGRLVVPCSGSGVYTLDVTDPARPREVAHWHAGWPGTGKHGGYPVCVGGAGDLLVIGTTAGNNPECRDDPACPYGGARLYSFDLAPSE
jgi:hypothetical protein